MVLNFLRKARMPLVLVAIGVLTIGFTCVGMTRHAIMHNADMSSVAITSANNQGCCSTNISKNIESWKSTLLVAPREMRDGLLILILGLIATLTVGLFRFRHSLSVDYSQSYRLYERDNPNLALFNHLKLAFAQGILNPKIY
jgi:hypothetical protein